MADIQLVLVEDDEQIRIAMRAALRSQDGIEVASEATNGETGLVLLESIDVDVAVVDASLPDMSLMEFAHKMREIQAEGYVTQSRLLILVNPGQETDLKTVFAARAEAYCLKQAPIEQLAQAVRAVYRRNAYLHPAIAQCILTQRDAGTLALPLKANELIALHAIAQGQTEEAIAQTLQITPAEVGLYLNAIVNQLSNCQLSHA